MSRRMLLLPVEGEPRMVEAPDFRAMAALIGADYIERVRVGAEWALAVDETGSFQRKPINHAASVLYGAQRHAVPIHGDALLGLEDFVEDGVDWIDTDEDHARRFLRIRGAA